ncbi:hypothetical protein [Clostridium cellulovorans]|uniref:Uncharacterized protein n=1 Tax=Clostridium cellulovorans (strain ATCC 35296 / DSM 3052 / OCM 3 / 743B) TaxID=573061 RepID=D9SRG5_CLOC7|nr:hypothetical protein [Clostridium cellulovorans]ADL52394.1 hypothetical protein Clocel_2694 [Clostridium cellulovorans 743B]
MANFFGKIVNKLSGENLKAQRNFNGETGETFRNQDRQGYDNNYPNGNKNQGNSGDRNKKSLRAFALLCFVPLIFCLIFRKVTPVDNGVEAKNAIKNMVSTSLEAGTVLMKKDENIGQKDYTINHKSDSKDTKIWVWDYAAEDGDYVQVLVNGSPISEQFMVKNKPKEFTVPTTGDIQIKGIKDGGGGITYAVHYDLNNTSYFNSAPENECNTYTLVKG